MLQLKQKGGNVDYDYEIDQFRDYHNAKAQSSKTSTEHSSTGYEIALSGTQTEQTSAGG